MNDAKANLARMKPSRKTGLEQIHFDGASLGADLLTFWQWIGSDLLSNATRGRLAEFIVAHGLGSALPKMSAMNGPQST